MFWRGSNTGLDKLLSLRSSIRPPARRDPAQTKHTFHRLYSFRIPHLSAPCVYIPPRFVLCSGQKGGSPMDQIKIGRFVAETRRAKGLTQRQLADQLSISDKTISKWETGVSHN